MTNECVFCANKRVVTGNNYCAECHSLVSSVRIQEKRIVETLKMAVIEIDNSMTGFIERVAMRVLQLLHRNLDLITENKRLRAENEELKRKKNDT